MAGPAQRRFGDIFELLMSSDFLCGPPGITLKYFTFCPKVSFMLCSALGKKSDYVSV